jgi:hypothetical protein
MWRKGLAAHDRGSGRPGTCRLAIDSEETELVVSLTAAQGGYIPKVGRSWRGELALLCDFPDAKRIAR